MKEEKEIKKYTQVFITKNLRGYDNILNIAPKLVPGVVIPLYDKAVMAAAYIYEVLGLKGFDRDTAIKATHKGEMRKAWSKAGLPNPKYKIVSSFGDVKKAISYVGYPAILKPCDGCEQEGIKVVKEEADLKGAFFYAKKASQCGEVIVEEFVENVVGYCVDCVTLNGMTKVYPVYSEKTLPFPYPVLKEMVFPAFLPSMITTRMKYLAKKAISAVGLRWGISNVEFLLKPNGKIIMGEMAIRPGSGGMIPVLVLPHIADSNPVLEYIYGSLDKLDNFDLKTSEKQVCVFRFINFNCGKITNRNFGNNLKIISKDSDVIRLHSFVDYGDTMGEIKKVHDYPAYIIIKGRDHQSATKKADEMEKILKDICR